MNQSKTPILKMSKDFRSTMFAIAKLKSDNKKREQ